MYLEKSGDQLLSRREAATLLGVTPETLSSWKNKKGYVLPHVRVGALTKYKLSDLRRFVEERTEGGDKPLEQ
jgi:hypothetical protein